MDRGPRAARARATTPAPPGTSRTRPARRGGAHPSIATPAPPPVPTPRSTGCRPGARSPRCRGRGARRPARGTAGPGRRRPRRRPPVGSCGRGGGSATISSPAPRRAP
ncbi:MAG: hypothetical protein E6G44_06675 [Actinobacteria bacterium]|nr:MAG: hypothetical protein E6G44_06675 [Actinomycetota bacterium]